jgi:hypothetical protein
MKRHQVSRRILEPVEHGRKTQTGLDRTPPGKRMLATGGLETLAFNAAGFVDYNKERRGSWRRIGQRPLKSQKQAKMAQGGGLTGCHGPARIEQMVAREQEGARGATHALLEPTRLSGRDISLTNFT